MYTECDLHGAVSVFAYIDAIKIFLSAASKESEDEEQRMRREVLCMEFLWKA